MVNPPQQTNTEAEDDFSSPGLGFDPEDQEREIPAPTPEEMEAIRESIEEQINSGVDPEAVAKGSGSVIDGSWHSILGHLEHVARKAFQLIGRLDS